MNFGFGIRSGAQFRIFEQKNAMTLLGQFGIGCVIAFMFIIIFCQNDIVKYIFTGLLVVLVSVFCGLYIYFAIKAPKLLQSERHIEQMAIIEQNMSDNKSGLSITDGITEQHPINTISHDANQAESQI